MGIFTKVMTQEVRLERMRPEQVAAAKAQRPAIYVPFGAMEWHGYHNPLGLDALKAHEQLVGLALRAGGVVYPPVYFGAGGGHMEWPNSFMVSAEPMTHIVTDLLHGFERDGYRQAILLSGHYPNAPMYLHAATKNYRSAGGTMRVLVLIENEAPDVEGDHAAKYETSSMLYLYPDLVDMQRLQSDSTEDVGGPEARNNWMVDTDPAHPCYGLVGIDPRVHASIKVGKENTEALLAYLEKWLEGNGESRIESN